jgi:uncharacterized protein with HEPN domain
MTKETTLYTAHILEAIGYIEEDISGHDFDRFRNDRRTRQLVERNLEIISEATRRLPANLKEEERGIEWSAIAGIGNVLRHDYHKSHPTILWETCQKDLEPLKAAVKHIQVKLGGV